MEETYLGEDPEAMLNLSLKTLAYLIYIFNGTTEPQGDLPVK